MMARELLSNKKLEEISYFNGYSNFTVYYSGGGIYCFTAKMDEHIWINGDTDGIVYFSDEEPTDEEFGNPEWQVAHNVVEELTEEQYKEWAYSALNFFIDIYKENGSDDDLICHANVDIDELKKIVNKMITFDNKPIANNKPELFVKKIVDIGGPIDAYIDYFFEMAAIDRYTNSDKNECPTHASEMAENLGLIHDMIYYRIENDNDSPFYIAITRDYDNDPLWFIVYDLRVINLPSGYRFDTIYKISGDLYEPDLEIVDYTYKTEIQPNYCHASDTTFLMKVEYEEDELVSMECVGFYSGTPNAKDTEYYANKKSLKATYK